ncbi:TrbI/VirB10 family protein [uncultured Erythrobacter sp.]|uniref:TrbI/VirB10 family protein n=1 Tax=uncultured Erythrobacter sp. TaxID=263913 RepID=UPI00261DAD8E|nr:TrbI/VirB10 family protein [uncultured Erythrobacter sp.]
MSTSEAASADPQDIRPVVPTGSQSDWGMWAFGAVLIFGGFMLYNALSASEQQTEVPSVFAPGEASQARIASPPPLRTPDGYDAPIRLETQSSAPAPLVQRQPAFLPQVVPPLTFPIQSAPPLPTFEPQPISEPPAATEPQVVFQAPTTLPAPTTAGSADDDAVERITADRLQNPSFTIPQGTVIPAVLETALDSTRAGGVRALVQRDVASFNGTRVLIPRGSRLYGEYEANLQRGQNRALVQWTRLIRPDGVTIALNSPSSDPLGRAGVRGKVDTKFFQRFGGAILQSVLDIGVGLAVNEASNGVLVALPGSTQNVQITDPQAIQPTLKVRHGTSVSVFVARDLDFSSVDR